MVLFLGIRGPMSEPWSCRNAWMRQCVCVVCICVCVSVSVCVHVACTRSVSNQLPSGHIATYIMANRPIPSCLGMSLFQHVLSGLLGISMCRSGAASQRWWQAEYLLVAARVVQEDRDTCKSCKTSVTFANMLLKSFSIIATWRVFIINIIFILLAF